MCVRVCVCVGGEDFVLVYNYEVEIDCTVPLLFSCGATWCEYQVMTEEEEERDVNSPDSYKTSLNAGNCTAGT